MLHFLDVYMYIFVTSHFVPQMRPFFNTCLRPTLSMLHFILQHKSRQDIPHFLTNGVVQSQTWQAKENVTPADKVHWCHWMCLWFVLLFLKAFGFMPVYTVFWPSTRNAPFYSIGLLDVMEWNTSLSYTDLPEVCCIFLMFICINCNFAFCAGDACVF